MLQNENYNHSSSYMYKLLIHPMKSIIQGKENFISVILQKDIK